MFTLNCKGKLITLHNPMVMGIINATPDSFFKGDLNSGVRSILEKVNKMVAHQVDIIDIGGQSTKPGSIRVSATEEESRVLPVIETVHNEYPQLTISVDTYYSSVARAAVEAGASIINDISAGNFDKDMIPTVASLKVPYIYMHMKGTPETMQENPTYTDVVQEVLQFFIEKSAECRKAGIRDLIIDPGFGFGKTITHNLALLKHLAVFKILNMPLLVGLSRKGTIYKTLSVSVDDALNGTTVLNTLAINNGADIIRVHDVLEAKQVITLMQAYKKSRP